MPQVCDLSAEELTFSGFEFKSGLFQLFEHDLQSHKMADSIFQEDDYIIEVYYAPIEVEVLRQVSIHCWKVAVALVSLKGILLHS